jgi:hypothetical protein
MEGHDSRDLGKNKCISNLDREFDFGYMDNIKMDLMEKLSCEFDWNAGLSL